MSRACPFSPISGKSTWREYFSKSSGIEFSLRLRIKGWLVAEYRVFEFAELGTNDLRLHQMVLNGFLCLQSIASDSNHGNIVLSYFTLSNELLGHSHGNASGCLGKDPFILGQHADAFDHLLIRNILRPATRFGHGFDGIVTVGGVSHGHRFSNGARFDSLSKISPCF